VSRHTRTDETRMREEPCRLLDGVATGEPSPTSPTRWPLAPEPPAPPPPLSRRTHPTPSSPANGTIEIFSRS